MPSPPSQFPRALAERSLTTTIAPDATDRADATANGVNLGVLPDYGEPIPVLLAHPDPQWQDPDHRPQPAPVCLWMHGRTANKELDPGRYLRWVRAGIAACAIDLPGHGQRLRASYDTPARTLDMVEQAAAEIDAIVRALASPRFNGAFDTTRIAIGGMSAGGMATLLRLTREHGFRCAAVEATTGDFALLADRAPEHAARAMALSPSGHLAGWSPLPLLALHSEKDEWVPAASIRRLFERLSEHYVARGADPGLLQLTTWPETGAPHEHIGFGRVSNDAKNIQVAFLSRWLLGADNSPVAGLATGTAH
jgi:dienelactone hydrolase